MLDKIIEKVVDWQKVCELLIIYVKKIDEIKNADENQIQDVNLTTFIFGDAIHDIFNNGNEGIDFSRIPGIIKAYKQDKNKFWHDLLIKYMKDKDDYSVNNLSDIISHFYVALYVCDTEEN